MKYRRRKQKLKFHCKEYVLDTSTLVTWIQSPEAKYNFFWALPLDENIPCSDSGAFPHITGMSSVSSNPPLTCC